MSPTTNDEQTLITLAQSGDRLALEKLLISYSPQLTAHIASRLPTSVQATHSVEDVTQEALTRAFLKIDRLRDTSPKAFAVWLKAIGEKTLMELIKAQRRQKRGGGFRRVENSQPTDKGSVLALIEQLPADAATASQLAAREEAFVALQVSMAGLSSDQRKAIEMHWLQKKTLDQTATEMGRSRAAIRGLLQRGKSQLGEAMGRASAWLSSK